MRMVGCIYVLLWLTFRNDLALGYNHELSEASAFHAVLVMEF